MDITTTSLKTEERKIQPIGEFSTNLETWLSVNTQMGIMNTLRWTSELHLIVEMSITSTTLTLAEADEQLNWRSKNYDLLFP